MIKLFIFGLLISSGFSYSCEEPNQHKSTFLKDIKATKLENCTQIQILFDEYSPSTDRSIAQIQIEIIDAKGNFVTRVEPEWDRPSYGNVIISTCISDPYLLKSELIVSSQEVASVKINNGASLSVGGVSLCYETETIKLNEAINSHKST
jgi:hypothetical protein